MKWQGSLSIKGRIWREGNTPFIYCTVCLLFHEVLDLALRCVNAQVEGIMSVEICSELLVVVLLVGISIFPIPPLHRVLLNLRHRKQLSGRTNGVPKSILHRGAYRSRGATPFTVLGL